MTPMRFRLILALPFLLVKVGIVHILKYETGGWTVFFECLQVNKIVQGRYIMNVTYISTYLAGNTST